MPSKKGRVVTTMNLTLSYPANAAVLYWMIIGQVAGAVCWINSDGEATPVQVGDDCDTYQSVLAPGGITIPLEGDITSARISLCVGSPLAINIVTDGNGNPNVQDAVSWLPTDPNYDKVWDKIEFTVTGGQIWANTTGVDFFGIPTVLSVSNGSTTLETAPLVGDRASVFDDFASLGSPWSDLAVGGAARVLAPGYGQDFPTDYLDRYIDQCWTDLDQSAGGSITLSLSGGPAGYVSATGSVVGTDLVMVDNLNNTYTVAKPSSMDVFLCNGALNIDGDLPPLLQQVDGIIKRQIGAGLNRGVLCAKHRCDVNGFYPPGVPTNLYSEALHLSYVGGLAYGFAYDDVCNLYSSTLSVPDVTEMTVTVSGV